ncbi:glycosyltransferase family 2 protein [Niallia sp. 03190]|uniref:glycosyltransferase family 2 protein n=1 Tax=Niallia sp. 03190 TaxID=3458061 RepID=UPI0040444FD9
MKRSITVSVIIPTYNRERYISKSVESVLNQTVSALEVLIIDDGSTDNTENVIKALLEKDNRIKYYKIKNGGANKARNYGISRAQGNYIAFNDSDDLWRENKLEIELNLLNKEGNEKFVGAFSKFNINYNSTSDILPKKVKKNIFSQLLYQNVVNTPNLIIQKSVLENVGKFNEEIKRFQDWDLALRITKEYNLLFIPKVLTDTFRYGLNISDNNKEAINSLIRFDQLYDKYRDKHIKTKFYYEIARYEYLSGQSKKFFYKAIKNDILSLRQFLSFQKFCYKNKYNRKK